MGREKINVINDLCTSHVRAACRRGCSVVGMMAAGLSAPLLMIDGVSLSHVTLVSNSSSAHSYRQPCVAYQDVRFAAPPASLACVQFQNFYAARISVSQQTLDKPGQWQLIVPWFDTMADAHCEGDAQDWHTITRKDVRQGRSAARSRGLTCGVVLHRQFGPRFKPGGVTGLRFHLGQPSPVWGRVRARGGAVLRIAA